MILYLLYDTLSTLSTIYLIIYLELTIPKKEEDSKVMQLY